MAAPRHDVFAGFEHGDGEAVGAQAGPDVLDRVELQGTGRQRQQGDVVGHRQGLRPVPSGAVAHENGMCAVGDGAGDLGEVSGHGLRVGVGHDQRGGGPALGADGTENAGPGVAGVARGARAAAARGPDAGQRALLADPSVRRENCPPGAVEKDLGC